jgi:hypothetical protein
MCVNIIPSQNCQNQTTSCQKTPFLSDYHLGEGAERLNYALNGKWLGVLDLPAMYNVLK